MNFVFKNDGFCIKDDEVGLKLMNCVFDMMDFVSKMMSFVFKMMNAYAPLVAQEQIVNPHMTLCRLSTSSCSDGCVARH